MAAEVACRPFDIATGPLFRAALIGPAPDDHVLLLHMHHIVSDGWSVGVLHEELRRFYGAFGKECDSPPDQLPLQYSDFTAWQRVRDERRRGEHGSLPIRTSSAIPLPYARFRPTIPVPGRSVIAGHRTRITLPQDLVERLRAISVSENVTTFMTFVAAFKTLLFRCNGQEDCLVGVPIGHRKELEPLIGLFTNTLVLRHVASSTAAGK